MSILWFFGESDADGTAPTLVSAIIVNATTLRLNFSEAVQDGGSGLDGVALTLSGGAATATNSSGAGTSSLYYTISRSVASDETGTGAYTQPGDGIEDLAGNDLATIASFGISILQPSTTTVYGSHIYLSPVQDVIQEVFN